jgi:hypothetical protein
MVFVTRFFLHVPFYDAYPLFLFFRLGEQHWETGFITVIKAEKQLQPTANCWTPHRKRCCWNGLIIPRYLMELKENPHFAGLFPGSSRRGQMTSSAPSHLTHANAAASTSATAHQTSYPTVPNPGFEFVSHDNTAHTTFSVHQLPSQSMPNHFVVPHPYFLYRYPPYNPHTPLY